MYRAIFTISLLYSFAGPAVSQAAPIWTGQDIAATADQVRTVKQKPQSVRSSKPVENSNHPHVIIGIGPSITVGVGSLDPNRTSFYRGNDGEERERDSTVCSPVGSGPARAVSAISSAARANGKASCSP